MELESVFIELTIPNKPNFKVGATPQIQQYLLQNLLNKIQSEKRFMTFVVADDFNLNLIKYSKTTSINQFLEMILSHNFMPQNNTSY